MWIILTKTSHLLPSWYMILKLHQQEEYSYLRIKEGPNYN